MELKRANRKFGLFALTLINFAIVGGINNWAPISRFGIPSILFFLLGLLLFVLPCTLVIAELGSTWYQAEGGIHLWIKMAFGHKTAFIAMWFLGLQSALWTPIGLSWITHALALAWAPKMVNLPFFHLIAGLIALWSAAFLILRGMGYIKVLSICGVLAGVLVPGSVIIAIGFTWLFESPSLQALFTFSGFSQELSQRTNIYLLGNIFLSLVGFELSAFHANSITDMKKGYPKALFWGVGLVAFTTMLGAFATSLLSQNPEEHIFFAMAQILSRFLHQYHLGWFVPLFFTLLAFGVFSSASNWMIACLKGVYKVAMQYDLPPSFRITNRKHIPTTLLVAQGLVTSVFVILFALFPNIHASYWILFSLLGLLYCTVYMILFAAAIRLRYTKGDVPRGFQIPGGKRGIWLVCVTGFIATLSAFTVFLFFPQQISDFDIFTYFLLLSFSLLLFCLVPWFILLFKTPKWERPPEKMDETQEFEV